MILESSNRGGGVEGENLIGSESSSSGCGVDGGGVEGNTLNGSVSSSRGGGEEGGV